MTNITIALDAMGGDLGPSVVVPAAIRAIAEFPNLKLLLFGDAKVIQGYLSGTSTHHLKRIEVHDCHETVAMSEAPSSAIRKRNSSMRLALNSLRDDLADACVSSGNTGALVAISRSVLKTVPGIDRPAIITTLPAINGHTHVLDLGANVYCNEQHLVQFAVMGSVLAQVQSNIANPKVGLLNIGEEDIKGNEQVKQAAKMLGEIKEINYIGFVEGDDIYKGTADVVVCDGFVGNIALKTSEGLAKMIFLTIKQTFATNVLARLAGFIAKPFLGSVKTRLDPRRYNGASLIGLRKPVIKSHGSADAEAYTHAIRNAMKQCEHNVPGIVRERIANMLREVDGLI